MTKSNKIVALAQAHEVPDPSTPKALLKLAPKKSKPVPPTTWEGFRDELRKAVRKWHHAQQLRIGIDHQRNDRKSKTTGEMIPSAFDDDERATLGQVAQVYASLEDESEKDMCRLVRAHPMWKAWLKNCPGVSEKTAAQLLACIDFTKCVKPSQLSRFCGVSMDRSGDKMVSQRPRRPQPYVDASGKLVKPKGETLSYNPMLKRALFLWVEALCKNASRFESISGSRYYRRFEEKSHGLKTTRLDKKPWWIRRTAQRCAERLFVEDLYIVGRTMLGLPVWPDYHASRLGYAHGGKICVNEPRTMTLYEALALVGGSEPIAEAAE